MSFADRLSMPEAHPGCLFLWAYIPRKETPDAVHAGDWEMLLNALNSTTLVSMM